MAVRKVSILGFFLFLFVSSFSTAFAGDLSQDVELTWGGDRAKLLNDKKAVSLTLDKVSGSGFQSKRSYLFGRFDMEIKLVPGNSAGTVAAYYLSSEGPYHDEIDFEFLGNLSGEPYTIHTNVYTQGKGNREQQFHLWFDPTKSFHLYSILWNPHRIIFLVDNIPIRVYENEEAIGAPFPKKQAMKLHSSLWDAEQWASRGGLVKTDWSKAPFTAYFRNFNANACQLSSGSSSCAPEMASASNSMKSHGWQTQGLNANSRRMLRWVHKYYMIYDYCTDFKRFPQGRPRECRRASRFL